MMEKVMNLLEEKPLTIPKILFKNYKNFNLTHEEFILLIYLLNQDDLTFNPKKIGDDLKITLNEVLSLINSIKEKGCINYSIVKVGSKSEEQFSFTPLYQKLAFLIVNNETKEVKTNIFDNFEQEFGRTLSPNEYEFINVWLNEFSEEVVLQALKEAVYNGVSNLRYIDKILYEWKKKGLKTKEDIEKDKENFRNHKKETTKLFDYDWLNNE